MEKKQYNSNSITAVTFWVKNETDKKCSMTMFATVFGYVIEVIKFIIYNPKEVSKSKYNSYRE